MLVDPCFHAVRMRLFMRPLLRNCVRSAFTLQLGLHSCPNVVKGHIISATFGLDRGLSLSISVQTRNFRSCLALNLVLSTTVDRLSVMSPCQTGEDSPGADRRMSSDTQFRILNHPYRPPRFKTSVTFLHRYATCGQAHRVIAKKGFAQLLGEKTPQP